MNHGCKFKRSPRTAFLGFLGLLGLLMGQASNLLAQEQPTEPQTQVEDKPADQATVEVAKTEATKTEAAKTEAAKTDQAASQPAAEVKKHQVKAEPFKIGFELDAVVDSPSYQVVQLRAKSLKELKLKSSAVHGQRVTQGQPVLQLDVEPWERAKRAAEQAVLAARLELEQAHKQAETAEQSVRLELEATELAAKVSREELDYFLEKGKAQQIESLQESLKSSEQYVEYAREEYEQLKKMYDADEITEETEEIVLRRAKNDLERSEYFLKNTRIRVERSIGVDLQRQEEQLKNAAARSQLDLELARLGRPQRLESVQLQLARAQVALESAERELAMLEEDRQLLTLEAQFPGILLLGAAERGQWKGSGGVEDLLVPEGTLPPNRPLMTVVGTERLLVQAKLAEKWLRTVKPGLSAQLVLTSGGNQRIPLECESVDHAPVEPGQYRATFRFSRPTDSAELLPLLTGKIHGVVYEKANALLVPLEALQYDQGTAFVQVVDASGQQRRQTVSVGEQDDKRAEIVQGLREGEYVVLP